MVKQSPVNIARSFGSNILKHKFKVILLLIVGYFAIHTFNYIEYMNKIAAQQCFTQAMLDAERDQQKRCLYVYDGEVWNPRASSSFGKHESQPCAEDVYCTIESRHFVNKDIFARMKDVAKYFTPSRYVGLVCPGENIRKATGKKTDPNNPRCSANPPTATPTTAVPTITSTPTPTNVPATPTSLPSVTTQPSATTVPTVTTTASPTSVSHCQPLGDVDCSTKINALDAAIILPLLGQPASVNRAADINDSGVIDINDLRIVVTAFTAP